MTMLLFCLVYADTHIKYFYTCLLRIKYLIHVNTKNIRIRTYIYIQHPLTKATGVWCSLLTTKPAQMIAACGWFLRKIILLCNQIISLQIMRLLCVIKCYILYALNIYRDRIFGCCFVLKYHQILVLRIFNIFFIKFTL